MIHLLLVASIKVGGKDWFVFIARVFMSMNS
jgi:hypothetical protein